MLKYHGKWPFTRFLGAQPCCAPPCIARSRMRGRALGALSSASRARRAALDGDSDCVLPVVRSTRNANVNALSSDTSFSSLPLCWHPCIEVLLCDCHSDTEPCRLCCAVLCRHAGGSISGHVPCQSVSTPGRRSLLCGGASTCSGVMLRRQLACCDACDRVAPQLMCASTGTQGATVQHHTIVTPRESSATPSSSCKHVFML